MAAKKALKRKRGQISFFTDANKEAILNYIRAGVDPVTAARSCGVRKEMLAIWISNGKKFNMAYEQGMVLPTHLKAYGLFVDDLDRAQAEADVNDLVRIDTAADTMWQAAAFKLKARHPSIYGEKREVKMETNNKTQIDGNMNISTKVDIRTLNLPVDVLRTLVLAMQKQQEAANQVLPGNILIDTEAVEETEPSEESE